MAKVSKNIKKYRKEKNITQDMIAEQLNVTRQAISNWENDKSQPDIESLKSMADFMHVEIEELIYGSKRRVGVNENKSLQKNSMRIILAALGSLFIGIGLVLLFYNYWQDFPIELKTAFSFIPLITSQVMVLFVFFKRKDNVMWREGAAILWTIGAVSTVALVNGIFNIHIGYENCLLIDAVMCLPIIYLLDAVSPIAVYFYMVLHWGSYELFGNYNYFMSSPQIRFIPVILLLLALGMIYSFLPQGRNDARRKYAVWLCCIATIVFVSEVSLALELCSIVILFALFAFFYSIADSDAGYSVSFRTIGIIGLGLLSVILSVQDAVTEFSQSFDIDSGKNILLSIVGTAVCIILIAAGFAYDKIKYKQDNCKMAVMGIAAFIIIVSLIGSVLNIDGVYIVNIIAGGALAAAFIASGVQKLKLFLINIGLLMLFTQIMQILFNLEIDTLVLGILFIIFGVAMIVINKLMSDKKRVAMSEMEDEND